MNPLADPAARLAVCFAAACALVFLIEPLAIPRPLTRKAGLGEPRNLDLAVRVVFAALVFAAFFAISWRPYYAFAGTVSLYAVFTAISRAKFEFVREPLVFADIALLPLLLRHREIFYANWIGILFWLLSFGYVFGASALFYYFEPSLLPPTSRTGPIAAGLAVAALPWITVFSPFLRQRVARTASVALGAAQPIPSTLSLGTFAYVVLHFLAWLGFTRQTPASERIAAIHSMAAGLEDAGPPIILIWQSESFFDMRRAGVSTLSLPNIDRLRERAVRWGLVGSVFEGGYTMRTEFSVIAGIAPEELGPDAYYPYLRAKAYSDSAWPKAFRAAGWATSFIHPYDRHFFRRCEAIPELGFDKVLMLDAFEDGREPSAYVTDARLVERVLDLCRAEERRSQLIFVASMENHGPWKPGRLENFEAPEEIYLKLLERADQALGELFEALDDLDRPAWVVFYGDHAPLLKSFRTGFPDPRTDYLIVPAGTAKRSAPHEGRVDTDPWNLFADLVAIAGRMPAMK